MASIQSWVCVLSPLLPCDWCRVSVSARWVQVKGVGFCSTLRHSVTGTPWAGPSPLWALVILFYKTKIGQAMWGSPPPLTPQVTQRTLAPSLGWGESRTALLPPHPHRCLAGWQPWLGWHPIHLPCRRQGHHWLAWVDLPRGCLAPIVLSLRALPGHNAACLLSLRSGLDKPSAFFFFLLFYESQQILPQRKVPGQWEPGVCQKWAQRDLPSTGKTAQTGFQNNLPQLQMWPVSGVQGGHWGPGYPGPGDRRLSVKAAFASHLWGIFEQAA